MEEERAVTFSCGDRKLIGILHVGENDPFRGVVIVVGGPQYRVGSHRQFVVMARKFAAEGIPVLRFDYRGMGDSGGSSRTFEAVDEDIRSSIDYLCELYPGMREVVLLGLCDAASAILMYCTSDTRVRRLVLFNPWVRTPGGEARSYLKHYYLQRLLQKSFWRKVLQGEFLFRTSAKELLKAIRRSRAGEDVHGQSTAVRSFISRMLSGLVGFHYPVLIAISGKDLTAREFVDLGRADGQWRKALNKGNVVQIVLPEADHTMSRRVHLDQACNECLNWLRPTEI